MRRLVLTLACFIDNFSARRVQRADAGIQGFRDFDRHTDAALRLESLLLALRPAPGQHLDRRPSSTSAVMQDRDADRRSDVFMQAVQERERVYEHLKIEKKWQDYWDEHETFKTVRRPGHPKKYVLDMFPYPSGAGLHVGHPEGYTATDILARFWRMKDFDVLHPMGWDAFGLPAEQHAINTGTHPNTTTYENIANFKRQLKSLGFSYDWSRELSTTDVEYVRWTQWIFLKLVEAGLAEQSEVSVNWCPALGTVLANEEIIDGLSERGNHPVKRMPLRQWVLKITEYADKLEEGLKGLDWPAGTLVAQKEWIGRSVGASIKFQVDGREEHIEVFTTRPDTLMGVSYVVLAPEHPLVEKLTTADQKLEVDTYRDQAASKSDMERTSTGKDRGKTGVFTGSFAQGHDGEKVPIWVADYVLGNYGTGAVMAVPAHDERDFEFASAFDLPIKRVVCPEGKEPEPDDSDLPFIGNGVSCGSGDLDGLLTEDMKTAIIERLSESGMGEAKVNYKLRDWVFSRQRYWGEPIPIYFPVEIEDGLDPRKGDAHRVCFETPIPVPDEDLPVRLPPMDNFLPGDDPQGCLARAVDWRYFQKDGKWFARETNTMPQWAGSCWYYLRYTDPGNAEALFGEDAASFLPVDVYVGGQEHAVLHLLYARFWHKVLYDLGVVDHKEPFLKVVHQGMILGTDGEKMSKSRGNVINPDDVVDEHGADCLRLYEMFMGPIEAVKPWQTAQVSGVVKFRNRCYQIASGPVSDEPAEGEILCAMHKTIKKVTEDIERLSFNTAISQLMVFSTALSKMKGTGPPKECVETLMLLVSPFAPHVAEEGWSLLGNSESLSKHAWPKYDEALCAESTITLPIQVNGKTRGKIEIAKDCEKAEALSAAISEVSKFLDGKTSEGEFRKVIYVPGKIINLVV